ncbi:MAG: 2-oxoglutarate ferredoxin oxidoreductase, alpha subunit [Deltaproteobacteria bacterium]|jgi:2-oxoglutarate ferredoxin oxidoreductase subunit alpha|nr:2-oxoglutarate ferredoxin oxidoreductase, alpha subunit [Deltaproteobacteria bacterium]
MKGTRVQTGKYFMMGNTACAEGALAAGCDFAAGYPITPATEIANRLAERLPQVGGMFLQMEDEISSIAAIIGASWTGKKVMTATSGPGISLMLENLGFAIGVETPCVIVNVQRGGPTTGMPTAGVPADMVQPKRGSHGDYEIIALCPASPQEMFEHTVLAFNFAEKYRVPVFILSDAFVGHMREEVVIPEAGRIEIVNRKVTEIGTDPQKVKGFLDEDVAPMPIFGRGFRSHVTSSCHDEYGKRNLSDLTALDNFIRKLSDKILKHKEDIVRVERDYEGAEVVLVSYGAVSRAAKMAAIRAREQGLPVGTLRLITPWPFPSEEIEEMARKAKKVIVLENNLGQMYPFIKAEAACHADVSFLPPRVIGEIQDPEAILNRIREVMK